MPPKAAARARKRAPPPVASDASQPEPPALPQDVNEELSFEDQIQSTPKPQRRPPNTKPAAQKAAATGDQPRRRGRPPRPQDEPPSASSQVNKDDELADESVDTPGTSSRGQRTGVLSDTLQEAAEEEAAEGAAQRQNEQGRKRKRGRPARTEAVEEPTEHDVEPQEPKEIKKRKRGRPSAQAAEEAQDEPYRHIGTKPVSIPRSKIETTWSPLSAPSIAIATSLIHLAERPVLQRLATNTKRRDHAAFALRTVSYNLARKLARNFPFPPVAAGSAAAARARSGPAARDADPRDEELDYERCLDAVKALERTQTGLLHGNALLRAEVAREEAALEKEYAELDALEANARSEVRRLREDMRKTHPLVPDSRSRAAAAAGPRNAEETLRVADAPPPGLFQDIDVPGLEGIGVRVGSHMESLRANLQPVEDVVPEIARSRAALRDVLAQHLEPQQFQEVLLG
ncbi:hypothetical protein ACHAQA_007293 [Verticillium albo-atrum]